MSRRSNGARCEPRKVAFQFRVKRSLCRFAVAWRGSLRAPAIIRCFTASSSLFGRVFCRGVIALGGGAAYGHTFLCVPAQMWAGTGFRHYLNFNSNVAIAKNKCPRQCCMHAQWYMSFSGGRSCTCTRAA